MKKKKKLLIIGILFIVFLATFLIPTNELNLENDLKLEGNIIFSNVSQPVLTIGMGNFTPSYIEINCEGYLDIDYPNMNLTLTYNESEMKIDLFELCLELEEESKMKEMTLEIIGDGYVWDRDATIPKYMLDTETGEIIEIE